MHTARKTDGMSHLLPCLSVSCPDFRPYYVVWLLRLLRGWSVASIPHTHYLPEQRLSVLMNDEWRNGGGVVAGCSRSKKLIKSNLHCNSIIIVSRFIGLLFLGIMYVSFIQRQRVRHQLVSGVGHRYWGIIIIINIRDKPAIMERKGSQEQWQ